MKKITFILFTMLLSTGFLFSFTGFGLSPIFEIGDATLPVTLSSFMALPSVNNQSIAINWTTQSESSLVGYHIHRAETSELSGADIITSSVIPAHNTALISDYSFEDREVKPETTYYYWLQSIEYDGANFHGPVSAKISNDNDAPALPSATELLTIYPNPFSGNISTNIAVRVKENETSDLSIYNIKGQLVRTEKVAAGEHNIVWNGLDNSGKRCSSGIYFVQMKSATYSKTSKVLLVK